MPDWFYRTVSQPLLFALPPVRGRDLALGVMGGIAKLPGGKFVVDVLGHMVPDERLARSFAGMTIATPVGIGLGLDMRVAATKALQRFGAGLIEVGPVAVRASPEPTVTRDVARQTLTWHGDGRLAAGWVAERLPARTNRAVVIMARLAAQPVQALAACCNALRGRVRALSIEFDAAIGADPATALAACQAVLQGVPIFAVVRADDRAADHAASAIALGYAGVIVDGALTASSRVFSPAALDHVIAATQAVRAAIGQLPSLIATGGAHQPADVLALLDAGASVVEVDSGMVFSGPGLIKRVDDALLHRMLGAPSTQPEFEDEPQRAVLSRSWFWLLLLGLAMVFGGALAMWIAIDHVLLPYDEVFVGLSRDALHALNPRLLDFLTHDRITLAGLMLSAGIIYTGLSARQIRAGWHWAEVTVLASGLVGFVSFFWFLGYGYFEPFHGFVTVVLLQFTLIAARSKRDPPAFVPLPAMAEDRDWRIGLWGQLCWILFGVGLLGAGVVISVVGVTTVFVPQDLAFMNTTPEVLSAASPRLVPMIAHDRATVGGMLLSCGVAYLLPALWGFRRGDRALWWTFVLAAIPAFAAALGVHTHVGYLDVVHLSPLAPALVLFALGAALSRPFLAARV